MITNASMGPADLVEDHPIDRFKVNIPEGRSGDWAVEKYTISEIEAHLYNLKDRVNGDGNRPVAPGRYTRLVKYDGRGERDSFAGAGLVSGMMNPTVWMSDTPIEILDHVEFIAQARGRVLIAGLGLGMCADAVLRKPEVDRVVVIEQEPDVIRLVMPTLEKRWGKRVWVIRGSIWELPPHTTDLDTIWFDIWPRIANSMYDDAKKLFAVWRPALRLGGWMGAWCWRDIVALRHRDMVDAQKIKWAVEVSRIANGSKGKVRP